MVTLLHHRCGCYLKCTECNDIFQQYDIADLHYIEAYFRFIVRMTKKYCLLSGRSFRANLNTCPQAFFFFHLAYRRRCTVPKRLNPSSLTMCWEVLMIDRFWRRGIGLIRTQWNILSCLPRFPVWFTCPFWCVAMQTSRYSTFCATASSSKARSEKYGSTLSL